MVILTCATLYAVFVALYYQHEWKKDQDTIASMKTNHANALRQERVAFQQRLDEQSRKVEEIWKRFIKIEPLTSYGNYGPEYRLMFTFDRNMILAMATHGDQMGMRYYAGYIASWLERELCTLNMERFREKEMEDRKRSAGRFRSVIGDPPYLDNLGNN